MARMRILTAAEQEAFNKPPQFNHRVRKQFFDLPKGLLDVVATLRSPRDVGLSGTVYRHKACFSSRHR